MKKYGIIITKIKKKGGEKMLYVLNALIVPINFDELNEIQVKFKKISIEEAKEIVKKAEWESAIGHEATAKVLSQLLEIEIPAQRRTVFFEKGNRGIHFFLKQRLPEGVVLSEEELKKLDFWLVLSEVM